MELRFPVGSFTIQVIVTDKWGGVTVHKAAVDFVVRMINSHTHTYTRWLFIPHIFSRVLYIGYIIPICLNLELYLITFARLTN